MDYLLIIDGNSLLSTSYYGFLPASLKNKNLSKEEEEKHYSEIAHASDGTYTNAIYGFMRTLLNIINNQKPSHIVVTWDIGRDTFRRKLYPEYKAQRKECPKPLEDQKVLCRKMLQYIGIKQFYAEEYEADDFSGSLAKYFEKDAYVRILTKDRDHLQLVDGKINLWLMYSADKSGHSKQVETLNNTYNIDTSLLNIPSNVFRVTPDIVEPFYGAAAESIVDLKALMGDTGDNIPGVPGIGEKTATTLINYFKTIDYLYQCLEYYNQEVMVDYFKGIGIRGALKVYNKLMAVGDESTGILGKEAAFLSKELATIKTDIDFGTLSLDVLKTNINDANLIASLQRLNMNSLLREFYPAQSA